MDALTGLRVIDVTQVIAGAYCSMLLADMGADVIKVENPAGGDDTRRMGSAGSGDDSPAFQAVNRNKRGIAVDLRSAEGVEIIRTLVRDADVFVENFRPGTLDRLGLGWDDLKEINPRLVYCSISGFGATGPYAGRGGFDLVAQGMSGLLSLTGEPGRPTAKVGVPVCDVNAAMLGAYGVLAATVHAMRTGVGQRVDTSLLEAGIALTMWETMLFTNTGRIAGPTGSAHKLSAPYEALRTKDGHVTIGAANQGIWLRLCAALERQDLADDARFAESTERLRQRAALAIELEREFADLTSAEVVERLTAAGVPCGPIYNISQVYEDPQARAREMLIDVEHPVSGETQQIGFPIKLSHTPSRVQRPAPLLGQHTVEVLREAHISAERIDALLEVGTVATAASPEPNTRVAEETR